MKRIPVINFLALLCAAVVFSGSVVLAGAKVELVETTESVFYNDYFMQELEPGIADLLTQDLQSSSEPVSSELTSSEMVNSEPVSSESVSSEPVSSEPVSSEPASSEPVSSEPVSSEPASSEMVNSEPVSSEPVSSEPVSSESVSSEPVSSEDDGEESSPEESEDWEEPPESSALLDMVAGAVQREIVGVNTPPDPAYYEAYKAQAVACHTYMEYHRQRNGSYPTMSYAKPLPETLRLTAEVLDQLLYYNGSPINAAYHAASGGHTQSARYVWGYDVPYLQGVESGYDSYESALTLSVDAVETRLIQAGISPEGDPEGWFSLETATYTDGDFINTIEICGTTVTGRVLRENILGAGNLKSPKVVEITCDGSSFTFYTQGFGHGTGLSQQGALGYAANEGWDYRQILEHYYSGAQVW